MTTVFISYSRSNQKFAETLRDTLHTWGYKVWIDVEDIPKGQRWTDEIQRGLENSDLIIGVMSPAAVNSTNVKNEWDWAIHNKTPLILLRIEKTNIPMHYIGYNYIDFVSDTDQGFTDLRYALIKQFALQPSTSLTPEVRRHVERYWQLARQFFIQNDYPLAIFFAINLIEEAGAMVLLGLPQALNAFGNHLPESKSESVNLDALTFADRREMVIRMTLYINSRVSRLYPDELALFDRWFVNNEFNTVLQNSLHLSGKDNDLRVPSETISRFEAFAIVCIAGEIYAEIQGQFTGVTPKEWERILEEIDDFREKHKVSK